MIAEAVADRAVRGRAAALDQDPLAPAEVDEVPDDQEVAGQVQLPDQRQLALDLATRLLVVGPIALARARVRHPREVRELRLARGHRVVREAIAEVVQREAEPIGQLLGAAQQVGPIGEEGAERGRRPQVALGVPGEQASGRRERAFLADAGQHVEQRAPARPRVSDAIRGHGGQPERGGRVQERLVGRLLLAPTVALYVEHHAAAAEGIDEPRQEIDVQLNRVRPRGGPQAQRVDARQRHEALAEPVEHPGAKAPRPFGRAGLHARDQPAQVAVAALRLDEQGQCPRLGLRRRARGVIGERQLRPDDRSDAPGPCRLAEPRRAAQPVAVDEGDGRIAQLGRPFDEVLRLRGSAKEREGGGGVQLDGHGKGGVSPFLRLWWSSGRRESNASTSARLRPSGIPLGPAAPD